MNLSMKGFQIWTNHRFREKKQFRQSMYHKWLRDINRQLIKKSKNKYGNS